MRYHQKWYGQTFWVADVIPEVVEMAKIFPFVLDVTVKIDRLVKNDFSFYLQKPLSSTSNAAYDEYML